VPIASFQLIYSCFIPRFISRQRKAVHGPTAWLLTRRAATSHIWHETCQRSR